MEQTAAMEKPIYWVHIGGKRMTHLGLVNHNYILEQVLSPNRTYDLDHLRLHPANELELSFGGRLSLLWYQPVERVMKHPVMQLVRFGFFVYGLIAGVPALFRWILTSLG